jgi:hypothetical protein|tara:strand:- start:612 stop:1526 length:915 start_codon:yes stop_codon:yes gene_type:complete
MKYIKSLDENFITEGAELNEAVNASGYLKAGKLGVNDQFLGRRSLAWTLSVDLGLKATDEYVGPWLGFDHVSMYAIGKKGGTILDNALTNKYTYEELKAAAAKFLGIKESVDVNEAVSRSDKAVKDLEKQGSQIDYLSDADDATKKIWKKAGVNTEDDNGNHPTIILYSYVNDSWPETKKILKKHSVDFKELEDPNSAGESFIVFVNESIDLNEAKKFKPGDMWSNDFDYDGMMKYALTVNHKTPIKTLTKLHDSATDVNYHTPFRGLGNAIDWITDDGVNSQEGKDFMKQFHNDIKAEIKTMR